MAIVNTHYGYCGKVKPPDLPGTWVLKDVLSAPESDFDEHLSFKAMSSTGVVLSCTRVYTGVVYGKNYLQYEAREGSGQFYNFTRGSWTDKYNTWVFYEGYTASPEFIKWLAKNATKQS